MQFEWDSDKAAVSESKHGVTFAEAATVFADELSKTGDDPDHSLDELCGTLRLVYQVKVGCSSFPILTDVTGFES